MKAIKKITELQYISLMNNIRDSNVFAAEINGEEIGNLDEYLVAIWKAFYFPQTGYVNYNAYLDWIRDLDWLNADGYVLIIRNYDSLMKRAREEKKVVVNSLLDIVIPWWESDVTLYSVGGKPKPFNVFLV